MEDHMMNRWLIAAILLSSAVLAAKADNDTYFDATKHGRGNDALDADAYSCAAIYGTPKNGTKVSRQFNRCMLGHGWRYQFTTLSPKAKPSPSRSDDDWSFTGCTFNPASSSAC
jgi:hypothetical protein